MPTSSTQISKLLPTLFQRFDAEQGLTVFHVGAALPETVDFFSDYRCKLHFIDVLSALPLDTGEDASASRRQQLQALLTFPQDTRFDLCLFWDLFNFLDSDTLKTFLSVLQPYLKASAVAHAFSVHNRKLPQLNHIYGIKHKDTLKVRNRRSTPPGYAPHSQRELTALLGCFQVERSVLLPDSRLELLLHRQHTPQE
ncbi:MAG: hypothetical protein KDI17_09430 [Halioglobus sp.]|nr:hypothetical protein [Halioglobus sp.]